MPRTARSGALLEIVDAAVVEEARHGNSIASGCNPSLWPGRSWRRASRVSRAADLLEIPDKWLGALDDERRRADRVKRPFGSHARWRTGRRCVLTAVLSPAPAGAMLKVGARRRRADAPPATPNSLDDRLPRRAAASLLVPAPSAFLSRDDLYSARSIASPIESQPPSAGRRRRPFRREKATSTGAICF